MRSRPFAFSVLLTLASASALAPARDAHADFDPDGRGNKKPKPPPSRGNGPPNDPTFTKPAVRPAGDKGEEGRSPDALIARYTGIVMSQPGAPFPLQRLAQLYRERDGNITKLVGELEKRVGAGGDDAWAARVALAGTYKLDGRYDEAIKTYEAAIADKPKEAAPLLALGQLRVDRGDQAGARSSYEAALPLLKQSAEIEQTTRILMGLCLDLKDFDAAKKLHTSLVAKSQGSLFVKAELGRELMSRGELERAETELRDVVKAAAGDNRALAPALKDLGAVLTKEKKLDEALETLKKALATASASAGIRAEIMIIMTDAFRAEGKLPELVAILEKEPGQDFNRFATLGSLYEETGEVDKAIATYRKAISLDSASVDVRLKLVHLLQTAGALEDAIKEYEALVKAAPGNPDYVFELCETLIQRGDRPKALTLLKELEGREAQDGDVLAAIADFYERVEEKDKAMAVLQRLANTSSGDPTFLIDLGDRYYQANDKKKALDTWARVKLLMKSESKADFTLGQVYLDHDMPDEALAALREAVTLEPQNSQFKKALAVALERTAPGTPAAGERFAEAVSIWQEVLEKATADGPGAKRDDNLAREARTHIVSVWAVTKELANKVAPLKARFESQPPDLEAGRLLAEVNRKLNKLPDAEAVLRKLIELAPGDQPSLLALERVLVQEQNLAGAIEVLQKLADRDTKGARQYYQRMAQYAAELYHDDDAIQFAAKAVELSPEDALGHEKLGDMYKKRQDFENAIAQYRQAIQKNNRLFPVYFDLAELLLSSGKDEDADLLFRKVVRAAPDEELVSRAARMSMQINLGRSSLETLERDLLPVAVGNPHKPVYRRMLVELYGAMTLPLVQKVRRRADDAGPADPTAQKDADAARAELRAIGTRAVKPLLDALADDREADQRIAIEVLAYVDNKSAGPSLFNFATGAADKSLRVRAMIACGALRDEDLLDRYTRLLVPKEGDGARAKDGEGALLPFDDIAVAAAWGVARMRSEKADAVLVRLVDSPSPAIRTFAAIGLGFSKNRKHVPELFKLASSAESGPLARSAALLSLGELVASDPSAASADASGQRGAQSVLDLASSAAESSDASLERAGILTLARLLVGKGGESAGASGRSDHDRTSTLNQIAASVFSSDPSLARASVTAATLLESKHFRRTRDPLPVPDGALRAEDAVASLGPDDSPVDERVAAFVRLEPILAKAAGAAVATSPEKASTVALAMRGAVVAPFLREGETLPAASAKAAAAAQDDFASKVVPGFLALARHPDLEMRTRAIEVLGTRSGASTEAAIIDALSDPEDRVRRAALDALASGASAPSREAVNAVVKLAKESSDWALRVRATEALGQMGRRAEKQAAMEALGALVKGDKYALVREAAVRAIAAVDPVASRPILGEVAKTDDEARVRDAATAALSGGAEAADSPATRGAR